ncbi:MAG TPA: hypothetical protein DCE41_00345 [Cytophagales bacterium]|nr:hypothetical protein [Cytophagales bacterium]HAA22923.1 hypothetical protein [Cytophagales bacterium]HAP62578.1 hypothetical protein [Cytophagales bacterium]
MWTREYWNTQWILRQKQAREKWSVLRGENYTRFVILSAPRTGSTLLHTYLNSHPHIFSMGERPRELIQAGEKCTLKKDVFRSMPKWTGAVGCKLFYSYRSDSQFQPLVSELVNDPGILVIHLTRSDVLRAYISEQKAWLTGHWNDWRRFPQTTPKMLIEEAPFRDYMTEIENANAWVAEQLLHHRVFPIAYEDLVAKPDQLLTGLQAALGVRQKILFSLLTRQNPEPLAALISNAEEARSWFPEPAPY